MPHQTVTISGYHSGDSLDITVTVNDPEGNAVDISGTAITFVIHNSETDTTEVSKTVGSGITITNGSAGRFEVAIDPSDTESLSGAHDIEAQVVESDGTVATVLTGSFPIEEDIIEQANTP